MYANVLLIIMTINLLIKTVEPVAPKTHMTPCRLFNSGYSTIMSKGIFIYSRSLLGNGLNFLRIKYYCCMLLIIANVTIITTICIEIEFIASGAFNRWSSHIGCLSLGNLSRILILG